MRLAELFENDLDRRKFLGILGAGIVSSTLASSAYGSEKWCVPNKKDPKEILRILKIALKAMNQSYDPSIPLPMVKFTTEISPKIYAKTWGIVPSQATRHYFWPENILILHPQDRERHIFHELVHYIQIKYLNIDLKKDNDGYYEWEAKRLENEYGETTGDISQALGSHCVIDSGSKVDARLK